MTADLIAIIRKLQITDLDVVASALSFAAHEMDIEDHKRVMLVEVAEQFGYLMYDKTEAMLAALGG